MVEPTKKKQETSVSKQEGKRKWLSRIGNFLMMGGFLLVIFLVVAIGIAVSLLAKGC